MKSIQSIKKMIAMTMAIAMVTTQLPQMGGYATPPLTSIPIAVGGNSSFTDFTGTLGNDTDDTLFVATTNYNGYKRISDQITITNSATVNSGKLQLTNNSLWQVGTIVRRSPIKLTNGFSTYFKFDINTQNGDKADGLAFVLYDASGGLKMGAPGGCLGLNDLNTGTSRWTSDGTSDGDLFPTFDNAIAVEFDMWGNPLGDGQNDHYSGAVAIDMNGSSYHASGAADSGNATPVDDGTSAIDHQFTSIYDATGTNPVNVWVDYQDNSNDPIVTVTYGLSATRSDAGNRTIIRHVGNTLLNSDVYVGFNASTGGAGEYHQILAWDFNNTYTSGGLTPGLYTQAAASVNIETQDGSNTPTATQPTHAAIQLKDAVGSHLTAAQNVNVSVDGGSATLVTTDANGFYDYPLTGLSSGAHTVTAVTADGSAQNSAAFTILSAAKAITSFVVTTPSAIGSINEGTHTVGITVPYGTNVTALTPTITHTGAGVAPNTNVAQDFTNPVTYTVTAADSSIQAYVVTVTIAPEDTYTLSGTITGSDAPSGLGATIQLKDSGGNNLGSALTAGADGNYSITGVSAGTGYTIVVSMAGYNNGTISAFDVSGNTVGKNLTLTRTPSSGGDDDVHHNNSGSTPPTTTAPSTPVTTTPPVQTPQPVADVNGQRTVAGIVTNGTDNGKTTTFIAIDDKSLNDEINSKDRGATVIIPFAKSCDTLVGELNGQSVKNMEMKEATLVIQTPTVAYTIPAKEINVDEISAQFGVNVNLSDIKIKVKIATPPESTLEIVKQAASKNNLTLIAPSVDFEIDCLYNGKTVHANTFNAYVERKVLIPTGVDPNKITTGVVVEPDGATRHVPTKVIMESGLYYAVINSVTNSTYSVVWHPYTFKDAENNWAKEAINDMGSRMVVSGIGDDLYLPERDITRAEFAAIVVRALGLKPGEGHQTFKDVTSSDWYEVYIQTAVAYGLIKGYGDGNFGPMDKISREQAITIIGRAMAVTELSANLSSGEASSLLKAYSDSAQVATYAQDSTATCVKTGIITGRSDTELAPKGNITRAEVAVIVKRLLLKSGLI